jgi:hypothetical protein
MMPEEPIPPTDPTPAADEEWTDESGYTDPIDTATDRGVTSSEEDWEDTDLDWEEDLATADADLPPKPMTTQEALAWLRPWWQRARQLWQRLLAGLKKRIPAAAGVSDGVLSGIVLGILVVLLLSWNSVRQASVASEAPPRPGQPPAATALPPDSPPPAPETSPVAGPESAPMTPPPPPAPAVDEADRDRIAQLQTQLTDGFLPNTSGMIDSIQADFAQNQLAVILTSDWYRLSTQTQVELADQLLTRATDLAFAHLELRSAEGELLARSPVVGNHMVILQREKPPVVEPPPRPKYRILIDR